LAQHYYFSEKPVLAMTQVDRIFFFRAACVSIKKIVSHVSRTAISLKIIAKNYFQLNWTGKFSVA